ncbi:MAG: hypothetical protein IIA92_15115, partial [Chloroflexi bacterium]|nr:hypothetical protein [Chloroflexota bacterium]
MVAPGLPSHNTGLTAKIQYINWSKKYHSHLKFAPDVGLIFTDLTVQNMDDSRSGRILIGGINMTQSPSPQQEIQQQAGIILSQVAGYVGVKTMEIGLRSGLIEEIAKHPQGISSDDLAKQQGFDPLYTSVWCRSAYAAEVLDLGENQTYLLAPHMETLLLDQDFPGNVGGLPTVFTQPEMFDVMAQNLTSGQRSWWDKTSPGWIQGVSATGQAFYNRLIPGGLSQVPGLADKLASGASVADWACGAGVGLIKMAQSYPNCSI